MHLRSSLRVLLTMMVLAALAACGGDTADSGPAPSAAPPPKAPDENAAIAAITEVNKAQADYFFRNRRYALTYDELKEAFFLKQEPTVEATGYDIRLRPSADAAGYTIVGIPASSPATTRHFFSDKTGQIRAETGKDASAQSPAI